MMISRRFGVFGALALLVTAAPALAQYDYGGGSSGGTRSAADGESGFILQVEVGTYNPRNADNVVATDLANSAVIPIIPSWDNDVGGRIGLGWGFANGSKIMGSLWSFSTDVESSGSGSFGLAIGPPISDGANLYGAVGGFFETTTELEASVADVYWAMEHTMVERFTVEWLLGLRFASYEETHEAEYNESPSPDGGSSYLAFKSLESQGVGARLGVRGDYRFRYVSIGAGMSFSFLDTEIDGQSGLDPNGEDNSDRPSSLSTATDSGRSGSIFDVDVRLTGHIGKKYRLWLGWEQARWDGIPNDPLRNFPGTVAPLQDRDSVTFSGYKLGFQATF